MCFYGRLEVWYFALSLVHTNWHWFTFECTFTSIQLISTHTGCMCTALSILNGFTYKYSHTHIMTERESPPIHFICNSIECEMNAHRTTCGGGLAEWLFNVNWHNSQWKCGPWTKSKRCNAHLVHSVDKTSVSPTTNVNFLTCNPLAACILDWILADLAQVCASHPPASFECDIHACSFSCPDGHRPVLGMEICLLDEVECLDRQFSVFCSIPLLVLSLDTEKQQHLYNIETLTECTGLVSN